jgi:hypothetical protein
MAGSDRHTSAHCQSVQDLHKKGRRGLADFAQDRKGSIAIKLGLIMFGPMVLLDAVIGLLS